MALSMTRFAYTAQAWAALAKNPVNRRAAVGALAQRAGGQLKELQYCFGEYDGVVIFDSPDDVAAAAFAVAATVPGHLKSIKTTRLLTTDEGMDVMRHADTYSFSASRGA